MNIKPQGAFVLVKKDPDEQIVSKVGIITRAGVKYIRLIPSTVIALGPMCGRYGLEVGDRVLVHVNCGVIAREGEEDYHFVREIDVQAKLEEDKHEPVA